MYCDKNKTITNSKKLKQFLCSYYNVINVKYSANISLGNTETLGDRTTHCLMVTQSKKQSRKRKFTGNKQKLKHKKIKPLRYTDSSSTREICSAKCLHYFKKEEIKAQIDDLMMKLRICKNKKKPNSNPVNSKSRN